MGNIIHIIGAIISGGLIGAIGTYLGIKKQCDTKINEIKENSKSEIIKLNEKHKNEMELLENKYLLEKDKLMNESLLKFITDSSIGQSELNKVIKNEFKNNVSNIHKKRKKK